MTTKDITRKMPDAQPAEPTEWGEHTDQGPREDNQDRVLSVNRDHVRIARKGVLLIVCDGVGGEEGGQIASQTAALTAYDAYYGDQSGDEIEQALRAAVTQANLAVKARAAANPRQRTMATTIVMTVVAADKLRAAHVGDSRAYLIRRGAIQQITNDHNWVSERMRDGSMTPEQAKTSTFKTTLTRSLGGSTRNEPDISAEISLLSGDRVMLCSDGVHGSVSEAEMLQILNRTADPTRAAQELVAAAKANKTSDNVSASVLNYGAPIGVSNAGATGGRRVAPLLISAVALLVALGVLAWVVMGGTFRTTNSNTPTPTGVAPPPTARATDASAGSVLTKTETTATVSSTVAVVATASNPSAVVANETPTNPVATSTLEPTPTRTNTPKPPTKTPIPTATATTKPIPTANVPVPVPVAATDVPKQEVPPGGGGNPQPAPTQPPPPTAEPPKPTSCPGGICG